MKEAISRLRHPASRSEYSKRWSSGFDAYYDQIRRGGDDFNQFHKLKITSNSNELNDSHLLPTFESSLSKELANKSINDQQDNSSNERTNLLMSNMKLFEFSEKNQEMFHQWHVKDAVLEESNIGHSDFITERNTNGWLSYMYSHNIITERPDMFLNHTDLELSIDVNSEQDTGNLSTSILDEKSIDKEMEDIVYLYKIVVPILLTACCLSFLFNLTMVCSVKCLRRKISPTICLSLSLAMADAYASLVIGLGLLVNSLLPIVFKYQIGPVSRCFILSLEAFRLGGLVVSVLHLLALAVNHYIGILRPLHYAHIVTRETTIVGIISMWIFPVIFFLVYFSSIPNDGFQSVNCNTYDFLLYSKFRITTSVLFFFPLILMTLMYSHMFILVRQHQKGLLQSPSSRMLHKNVKAIITTLLILGTYILGWMPAVMYFVLTCLDCLVPFRDIPLDLRVPVGIFINSMIVAKSFMDPVIYVVRMPEIKSALKTIFFTRCGYVSGYMTPSNSRTDTRRLTLQSLRRKSKLNVNLNARNDAQNDKLAATANGKNCSRLVKNGAFCCKNGALCETVLL